MTEEQKRVAYYAQEYAPNVSDHVVDAIVHSVGETISEAEALDILDHEQGLVRAGWPRRRRAFLSRVPDMVRPS